ncbi:MAG: 2-amino-4-hydroxy-6-hydroxymethyldihydropteridine diphosphokinase [Chloroflexota bacterium]
MVDVHLGIGSNVGDRMEMIRRAVEALSSVGQTRAVSSVYETTPFGVTDQPDFLNCCVALATELTPAELLARTRRIERDLGRVPGPRWGPRTVDIDLLLYGGRRVRARELVVPHLGLLERAFVLVPLAEIAADQPIPGSEITVAEALARVAREPGDVRRVAPPPGRHAAP